MKLEVIILAAQYHLFLFLLCKGKTKRHKQSIVDILIAFLLLFSVLILEYCSKSCFQCLGQWNTDFCWQELTRAHTSGYYSSLIYLVMKFLNAWNIAFQLSVINRYVGDGTLFWGIKVICILKWMKNKVVD